MLIIPSILLSDCLIGLIILLLLSDIFLVCGLISFLSSWASIFFNKISAFFILLIFIGLLISLRSILKLNVFAIFSQVSGMNGERRIVKSLIAFASLYRTFLSLVIQGAVS